MFTSGKKSRRQLSNLVVNPRSLLWFAVPLLSLLIGISALMLIINVQMSNAVAEWSQSAGASPESLLSKMISIPAYTGSIGLFILSALALIMWLIFSHRIFGPIFRFRKHIEELCRGNFDSHIQLRRNDEFKELAEDLNRLAEYLKSKSSQKGFGLVEVLLAMGLMCMMALVVSSIFDNHQKQLKLLTQKQESTDLKNIMLQQLSRADVCTWQLKGAGNVVNVAGNPTISSPSPSIIQFTQLRYGPDATSEIMVKVGEKIPGSLNDTKVKSISFGEIFATGNPNEYSGSFSVQFDASTLPIEIKPLKMSRIFTVVATDPKSAAHIDSCGGASAVPMNCLTVDSARPWVRRQLVCSTSAGGKSLLTLSFMNPGGPAIYAASHGDNPLVVVYDADTGAFVKDENGPPEDAATCINKNLKVIVSDANNACP